MTRIALAERSRSSVVGPSRSRVAELLGGFF